MTENGNAAAMREALEGNQMKMRETLVAVKKSIDGIGASSLDGDSEVFMMSLTQVCARLSSRIEAALSKPPRNCDVGTAEEQYARFRDWCRTKNRPSASKGGTLSETAFRWAQSPYGGQVLPKRRTETELYRDCIAPQVDAIVGRCGGYREGFGDELRTVLFALSRYCLSLGRQLGYDEGRGDARRGRDSRIDPKNLHLN